MKKVIKLFPFFVCSAFFGVILVAQMALDMLEAKGQLLRDIPSDEGDLVEQNMRGWLESEGLSTDLTENILNQFRSNTDLMSTIIDYNATITQQIENLLNIAQLFSIVGLTILLLGLLIYPRLRESKEK